MANQVAGVTEKLIKCATEEFLLHGFQNASLRNIAEKAGTSTKSIYVRFDGKQGLFDSIIGDASQKFKKLYLASVLDFEENHQGITYEDMFEYTDGYIAELIDCVFDNYNAFRLLICYSDRAVCAEFIDSIAAIETKETVRYISKMKDVNISAALIHMLSTAYISGFFEMIRHGMNKTEAMEYSSQLKAFFRAGWLDIFNQS